MPPGSLLDQSFVQSHLTVEDPWCHSHGSGDGSPDLGAGILYYAIPYALKAETCVCLGSGGGFVPRLMRQAQRDLKLDGARTILVDGAQKVERAKKEIWGSPCWEARDSRFRINYPDIEIILDLTEQAYRDHFSDRDIDYLHIDADHHYEGVRQDWDLYSSRVTARGMITLHDTVNYREPCGVYRLLDEIREEGGYEMVNFPIAYGTAILRRSPESPNATQ